MSWYKSMCLRIFYLLIFVGFLGFTRASSANQDHPSRIIQELDALSSRVESSRILQSLSQNMGDPFGDLALKRAGEYLNQGYYKLAESEARAALLSFQKTDSLQAMAAYRIQGIAYSRQSQFGLARRALQNYLAAAQSIDRRSLNKDEVAEVIQRWFELTEEAPETEFLLMNQTLVALSGLLEVIQDQALMYFYLGESALRIKNLSGAKDWFLKARELDKDGNLQARLAYHEAIIAYEDGRLAEAKQLLLTSFEKSRGRWTGDRFEALVALALAKLSRESSFNNEAQLYLAAIPETSSKYFEASREAVEAFVSESRFGEALIRVRKALALNPKAGQRSWFEAMIPLLLLKNGEAKEASEYLASLDSSQAEFSKSIKQSLGDLLNGDHGKLSEISRSFSEKLAFESKTASRYEKIRTSLISQSTELEKLSTQIEQLTFQNAFSISGGEGLQGNLEIRRGQLSNFCRVLAMDAKSMISMLANRQEVSSEVRQVLGRIQQEFNYEIGKSDRGFQIDAQWRRWLKILESLYQVVALSKKLDKLKAEESALVYSVTSGNQSVLDSIKAKTSQLSLRISKTIVQISNQASFLQDDFSHGKVLEEDCLALLKPFEAATKLSSLSSQSRERDPWYEQMENAVKLWRLTHAQILRSIKEHLKNEKDALRRHYVWSRKTLYKIWESKDRIDLIDRKAKISLKLLLPQMEDEYRGALTMSASDLGKWQGDLEWLRIEQAIDESKKARLKEAALKAENDHKRRILRKERSFLTMLKFVKAHARLLLLLIFFPVLKVVAGEKRTEPLKAFEKFWSSRNTFEHLEYKNQLDSLEADAQEAQSKLEDIVQSDKDEAMARLIAAKERYSKKLENTLNQEQRAYLLFNLGQVIYLKYTLVPELISSIQVSQSLSWPESM